MTDADRRLVQEVKGDRWISLAIALVPLGVAIMEHQGKVEAEGVTADVIRAVSASLEGWEPCGD